MYQQIVAVCTIISRLDCKNREFACISIQRTNRLRTLTDCGLQQFMKIINLFNMEKTNS